MANSISDKSESANEVENMLRPHQSCRRSGQAPGSGGWSSSKAQPAQNRSWLSQLATVNVLILPTVFNPAARRGFKPTR